MFAKKLNKFFHKFVKSNCQLEVSSVQVVYKFTRKCVRGSHRFQLLPSSQFIELLAESVIHRPAQIDASEEFFHRENASLHAKVPEHYKKLGGEEKAVEKRKACK
ncbi:hypothetical protein CDAR_308941 [Caerostris darwini]|uniref:Uncharacterized protein n=1 Tax=Caerostris darwini TaxID=1538125 RepID=A0AAV4U5T9_9ARAC|nr:hypothetical protein CDAR_308941 [Caerostris darwini]